MYADVMEVPLTFLPTIYRRVAQKLLMPFEVDTSEK